MSKYKNLQEPTEAVIFARVSTIEQSTEGQSIEAQIEKMRDYCKRNNLAIIKEFQVVESSTKGDRPEFNKFLEYVRNCKRQVALVCDKVDRLQRSIMDIPKIDALVCDDKACLHFLDIGKLDHNANAQQKAFYRLAVVIANAYTDAISDNIKRANQQKRLEGTILGPAPIGYLNLPHTNNQKRAVVGLDPERAFIIKQIFEDYATGLKSMEEVRLDATKKGLRSLRGGKKLGKSQIEKILSNPFYYGMMTSQGESYPHIYEKLITKELFDQCQEVRYGKRKEKYKRTILNNIDESFQEQVVQVSELANKSYDIFKSSKNEERRKIVNILFPNLLLDGAELSYTLQKPLDKWIEFKDRPLWLPLSYTLRTKYQVEVINFAGYLQGVQGLQLVV